MFTCINKILIIHTWGIGDLVMATPALRILRESFPKAIIDILVKQTAVSQVLQEGKTINRIFKLENLKKIFKLRKKKYDLVFVSAGINPWKGGLFSFLIGAKFRIGEYRKLKIPFYTHQVLVDARQHKVDSNLSILNTFGLKIGKNIPRPFFEFDKESKEFAKNFILKINGRNKILIGFHPGAGAKQWFKVWHKENFIKLGQKITKKYKDARIIIFGGPTEQELCETIRDKINKNTFLAINFNLKKVAAIIDSCQVFVSSDSGLGHIAATTKTNLISIFGPTNPKRTGPIGPRVRIIKKHCNYFYNDISGAKHNAKKSHKCLQKITPERVFNGLENIIKSC